MELLTLEHSACVRPVAALGLSFGRMGSSYRLKTEREALCFPSATGHFLCIYSTVHHPLPSFALTLISYFPPQSHYPLQHITTLNQSAARMKFPFDMEWNPSLGIHTCTHTNVCMYIYLFIGVCVCVMYRSMFSYHIQQPEHTQCFSCRDDLSIFCRCLQSINMCWFRLEKHCWAVRGVGLFLTVTQTINVAGLESLYQLHNDIKSTSLASCVQVY